MALAPSKRRATVSAGFSADIVDWVSKVGDRLEWLPKEAAQMVYDEVRLPVSQGGHMPVVTGNLRNSFEVSLFDVPPADVPFDAHNIMPDNSAQDTQMILSSRKGGHIYMGFRAQYADIRELRYGFVRLTAQSWNTIVDLCVDVVKRTFP